MTTFAKLFSCVWLAALPAVCGAQQWEIGATGGAGFATPFSIKGSEGAASAGFRPGFALGAFAVNHLQPRLSGELRYTYLDSDLKLSAGGTKVTFPGMAHAIHYDLLVHPREREGEWQPFLAVGGGVKVYRGTGEETAYQPLSQYAFLTHTQQVEPLVSIGGGVQWKPRPRIRLRLEVRDYLTPFPKQIIAPAGTNQVSGWIHNFVPLVSLGYLF